MSTTRTLSLKVHFDDRAEAATCLQDLQQIPGASITVVRGRVTPSDARYDLEIRGEGRRLSQAIRSLRGRLAT